MSARVGAILMLAMVFGAVPVAMGQEAPPTAGQALAQNTAGMEKVLKAVAALGIADKDIQTINVSVNPPASPGTAGCAATARDRRLRGQ